MALSPVVIVGSGFAGTILARALNARSRPVLLLERGAHPRFALGESSTPLASICLERLALEYDLPDLLALAGYARWNREWPGVRHGLKRGFSFYGHRPGHEYENGPRNEARLLVAASPDDEIADSHWLRSDVDRALVDRAVGEGVSLYDQCEVERAERTPEGWVLEARRAGRPLRIRAGFVVDATGGSGFLREGARARSAGGHEGAPCFETGLVFGHFEGVGSFVESAASAALEGAPYPEERAAVHHLLDEGWMYVLRFDDGLVSAGFVIDRGHPDADGLLGAAPADAWGALLDRYPTLRRQFVGAEPVRPIATRARLQRRAVSAAARGWAALPHAFAFASPMFSTGIAWSLAGVERLAAALTGDPLLLDGRLEEYERLLQTEADHIAGLVGPAYAMRRDFSAFAAWSYVYFAAASYHEAWQRLCDAPSDEGWSRVGFLGACDPAVRAAARVADRLSGPAGESDLVDAREALIARCIEPRNIAGLADPARSRAYPVDLDALASGCGLLGLSEGELQDRLPRLRGGAGSR